MWEVELHSLDEFPDELTSIQQSEWLAEQQPAPSKRGRPSASASSELHCRVCELPASGNNFGVTTCESCKTFFRRNAKREAATIRCLHQGSCNVTKEYRRSCTACRLKKCFSVGMKKELILSEEKLRQRARPTFKKPRYRWCRLPANVDVEQLLSLLPPEQRPEQQPQRKQQERQQQQATISIKQESVEEEPELLEDSDSRRSASPLSESLDDFSSGPDAERQSAPASFEASQVYSKFRMCVTNYQLPYSQECAPTLSSKLVNLEEGFSTLENSIRKMIRVIPEMPFFEDMDRALLGRIVKFKVFGAIQVISVLTYDYNRDAWVVLLQNGRGLEEAVINAKEAMLGAFMGLTRRRWQDGRPLLNVADVEKIYQTLTGYYRDLRHLFADQRQVAAVILLAVYLLEDDTGLELADAERELLRRVQRHYLRYLAELARMQRPPQEAEYACAKAALLMARIRWLDLRYSDASRVVQIERVPALMQELAAS